MKPAAAHIAARPSDIAKMPAGRAKARVQKQENSKASVRAKVDHPFRVIKRQFGLAKVRFRWLQKNTVHLLTLFAPSNLWMARHQLMKMMGSSPSKSSLSASKLAPIASMTSQVEPSATSRCSDL